MNRPDPREVLECGGWRGTGLTPLWMVWGGSKPKRCVPSPLTPRTPNRWRVDAGRLRFRGSKRKLFRRILTLALSLGEREKRCAPLKHSDAATFDDRLPTILPLPSREG